MLYCSLGANASSSFASSVFFKWLWAYWPVKIDARDGQHQGVVTKPFGNSVPPETPGAPSLNHLRVLGIASCAIGFEAESPSMVSARWSSVTISSTLGSGLHS